MKDFRPLRFLVLLAVSLAAFGLVVLGLSPPPPEDGSKGVDPFRITAQTGLRLEWIERRPSGAVLRRIRSDSVSHYGRTATTDAIDAWFHPAPDRQDTRPVHVKAPGAWIDVAAEAPTAETVVFAGTSTVTLPNGWTIVGRGVRWSRGEGRIRSDRPVRMEGEGSGWIVGRSFALVPEEEIVVVREVKGEWPVAR